MRKAVTVLLAALLAPGASAAAGPEAKSAVAGTPADPRATAAYRLHHREVRAQLVHLDRLVARLPAQEERRRRDTMREVVARLEADLRPHVKEEEAALYPAVDDRAGGAEPFTSTMRREHRIIDRWIADLDREASRDRPNPQAFARLANRLLGLVEAHFELEEEVLLPFLDRTMTARQFQEEVADRMGRLHETLPRRPSPASHRPETRPEPGRRPAPSPEAAPAGPSP